MVGDSHNHHDAGVICLEDLADGVYIDIYLLTGITNLSDVTYDPWAICPQSEDFDVPYDSDDFQGCWHETITLVLDSQEFHVPKRLASARLPYVKTYLGSAFAGGSRIELGIEAPAKALDSLLGIIMGGRQYFEDWWDKNDYGGSLELIKVADFLGCTELVMIIEDLLIKELQVDQSVEESLMVCYSSGFPNLARLKCACLHTAAFEVLVRLCHRLRAKGQGASGPGRTEIWHLDHLALTIIDLYRTVIECHCMSLHVIATGAMDFLTLEDVQSCTTW